MVDTATLVKSTLKDKSVNGPQLVAVDNAMIEVEIIINGYEEEIEALYRVIDSMGEAFIEYGCADILLKKEDTEPEFPEETDEDVLHNAYHEWMASVNTDIKL